MIMDGVVLPAVGEVRILRLRRGDTVVLYLDNPLDDDAEYIALEARLKEKFPDNEAVIISGARLEVLRRDDDEVT